jgi:hypothetical protein
MDISRLTELAHLSGRRMSSPYTSPPPVKGDKEMKISLSTNMPRGCLDLQFWQKQGYHQVELGLLSTKTFCWVAIKSQFADARCPVAVLFHYCYSLQLRCGVLNIDRYVPSLTIYIHVIIMWGYLDKRIQKFDTTSDFILKINPRYLYLSIYLSTTT